MELVINKWSLTKNIKSYLINIHFQYFLRKFLNKNYNFLIFHLIHNFIKYWFQNYICQQKYRTYILYLYSYITFLSFYSKLFPELQSYRFESSQPPALYIQIVDSFELNSYSIGYYKSKCFIQHFKNVRSETIRMNADFIIE